MPSDEKTTPNLLDDSRSPAAKLRTIDSSSVQLNDGFLSSRRAANREQTLPFGLHQLEITGAIDNFRIAAGRIQGKRRSRLYSDSDLYKWLEAASYELGRARREKPTQDSAGGIERDRLEEEVDEVINAIAGAQREDGYLNTYYQLEAGIEKRWTNVRVTHELYCAGHLIQAAVAHRRATGKGSLLEVARRYADHIDSVFGSGKHGGVPGHPEIELALIELYRETREARYLRLAEHFLRTRGAGGDPSLAYTQEHAPITQVSEVAGHAVRQLYLLCGAADLYLETGDEPLLAKLSELWDDMRSTKMSINGGVGSRYEGEAFGESYELPNDRVYNETCAQIASFMWSWRMLLATGEPRYADLMEWTLYNGILCGVSLDGRSFFYPNPLMSRGAVERSDWFECACCPPNVMRTLASLENYVATGTRSGLQIHLYDRAEITTRLPEGPQVGLRIETDYPWDGNVQISIDSVEETGGDSRWELALRIPFWSRRSAASINGAPTETAPRAGSYLRLDRVWRAGDRIELHFAIVPNLQQAHPYVQSARGCVAVTRGPLLYCIEGLDQSAPVADLVLDEIGPLTSSWEADLLGGVAVVHASGLVRRPDGWDNGLYRSIAGARKVRGARCGQSSLNTRGGQTSPDARLAAGVRRVDMKAIPYFAWANRGRSPMTVWIPAIEPFPSA